MTAGGLEQLLGWLVSMFHHHGAMHPSIGAVSDHLGWVTTKHWIIRVCRIGSRGCHL